MDPIITKMLEGVPFNGMGSTLERNALIGVIRNLISEDKYTVDYILNYAESVGYQRQMAEDVFKELTGLSPKLIVNNNAYYDMPAGVPNMCIAWGISKSTKDKAYYIVPFEYGYATMETDGINAPIPTVISATIPEAFDELKKVAKNIQTLDKIITKKLLETENVQSPANDVHQVNIPYSASPLQVLKKSFKDKVLSVSEFERQASKMLQAGELTVDEAEDLMNWKQDLIDEDESYANEVLENNEKWNEVQATVEFDDIYNELKEIAHHDDETFNKDKVRAVFEANKDMFQEVDLIEAVNRLYQLLLGFSKEEILGHSEFKGKQASDSNLNTQVKKWYTNLYKTDDLGQEINPNVTFMEILSNTENTYSLLGVTDSVVRERVFEEISKRTNIPYEKIHNMWMGKQASKKVKSDIKKDSNFEKALSYVEERISNDNNNENDSYPLAFEEAENLFGVDADKLQEEYDRRTMTWRSASKKVTAENMTLDDIEAEDNKDQVQDEIEKINETPVEDIFAETTPEQYLDKALQEDKVDTINDVVSKCIDKFSEKFKDFDKYQVKILSYNTKVLGDYEPTEDELVEDKELNANAILEVILQITNNADETSSKKALAVFSITNGELHWTGTVRGENDQVVAFTEEGLDALFEVEEVADQELEDII